MGNLGFQELLLICIVIVIPVILIAVFVFLLVKYLNKRNQSKSKIINVSTTDELERLHSLKEKGIITQEEFDNKKAQFLNRI